MVGPRRASWNPLVFFNLKKEIQAFEDQVKAAYLKMARDAGCLVEP